MRTEGTGLAHGATFPSMRGGQGKLMVLKTAFQKGQALFSIPNVVLAGAGFLLGRATLLGEIAPFGAVFWLLALREKPLQSFLVAAAVLAGRATVYGIPAALNLLGAMAAVWLMEALCLKIIKRRMPLLPATAVLVMLGRLPAVFIEPNLDFFLLVMELVIGCLAAVVMLPALRLIDHLPRSRDRPRWEQDTAVALFLLFVLCMIGLKDIFVYGLSVEAVANQLCLLMAASFLGAGWGAAMGIITGTILGLGNPQYMLIIGSLSFSGFWAGLLRTFGRWGCAAGFLFSLPVLFILAPGEPAGFYWREGLLSLVLFLAVPSRYLGKLSLQFQRAGLGLNCSPEEQTRNMVADKFRHFAGLFNELSLGFTQASAGKQMNNGGGEPYSLLEELMNRVCRTCLFRRRCWEQDMLSHHRLILDLLAQAEQYGEVETAHLPPAFRERCHQPEVLVKAINNLQEIWRLNQYWEARIKEGKELVTGQLEGLSAIMLELAEEISEAGLPPVVGEQAPLFNLEIGLSQSAGADQAVCGDSFRLLKLESGLQAVILSDGMGNGPRASQESKLTVNLLKHLLEIGFKTDVVLKCVNSLLQLRSGEEIFATVDLAFFDLSTGDLELFKIGAAPSFLKRGRETHKLGASSLPMGILAVLENDRYTEKLQPGDLLVMVTDGAADPDGDTTWLLSFLRRMEACPPQVIAERIVEETHRRAGGAPQDDLTVVVCRLLHLDEKGV